MRLVSVIIPTYNGVETICRSIQSVLNSTYGNYEIIVVDDNGEKTEKSKQTRRLVESFQKPCIKYICHKENRNGAAARNTGLKYASGEYITFLDDDDYILPERIEKSVFQLNQGADVVFTDVCKIRKGIDYKIYHIDHNITYKNMIYDELAIGTGSNLFLKKELCQSVQGFDENYYRFQDREFAIRVCKNAHIAVIPEILIIKGRNLQDNTPSIKKSLILEKMFEDKFHEDIENLSEIEKKKYILSKTHKHLELYLMEKDYYHAKKQYTMCKMENDLKLTEKIAFILIKMGINLNNKIILKMKNIIIYIANTKVRYKVKSNNQLWRFIVDNERQ